MAHVELRVGDLDALGGELLQHAGQVLSRRGTADDEVALETDAVDLGAGVLDQVNDAEGGRGLGAGELDRVVVVVQFRIRVGSSGSSEGDGEVGLANGLVKDVVAERPVTIVADGLVDDVPGVALALVVLDLVGDVVLEDVDEGLVGPRARRNPRWELVVPDKVVASKDLGVRLGKVGDHVTLGVRECPLRRLNGVPFLRVARCDLAEFCGVVENGSVGCVGKLRVVGGGAEVLESGCHGELVELGVGTCGGGQRQSCLRREVHCAKAGFKRKTMKRGWWW